MFQIIDSSFAIFHIFEPVVLCNQSFNQSVPSQHSSSRSPTRFCIYAFINLVNDSKHVQKFIPDTAILQIVVISLNNEKTTLTIEEQRDKMRSIRMQKTLKTGWFPFYC